MNHALSLATNLFPIWVLAGGALALIHPAGVAAGFGADHHAHLRQHHRQQRGGLQTIRFDLVAGGVFVAFRRVFVRLLFQPPVVMRRSDQPRDFRGGGHAKLRAGRGLGEGAFRANAAGRPALRDFGDVSFGHRQFARGRLAGASDFVRIRCDGDEGEIDHQPQWVCGQ